MTVFGSMQSSPMTGQSPGHVVESSVPLHVPSPHIAAAGGQSAGQLALVSPASQVPLGHTGPVCMPQSDGQLPTSVAAQVPSPHTACCDVASTGGGVLVPLPSPQAHALKTAHTNASVDFLIEGHPTEARN
jgi:hypothetical protein